MSRPFSAAQSRSPLLVDSPPIPMTLWRAVHACSLLLIASWIRHWSLPCWFCTSSPRRGTGFETSECKGRPAFYGFLLPSCSSRTHQAWSSTRKAGAHTSRPPRSDSRPRPLAQVRLADGAALDRLCNRASSSPLSAGNVHDSTRAQPLLDFSTATYTPPTRCSGTRACARELNRRLARST